MSKLKKRISESDRVLDIFRRLAEKNSDPTTELCYETPFQLLVAVILSAQSTDARVNLCTPALFKEAPDPLSMAALGIEGLIPKISSIGLYRNKAEYILQTSRILVEQYGGTVPDNLEKLMALPGVGRKTANVILNTLFKKPCIAVDTHVARVSQRLRLSLEKTPEKIEKDLIRCIPETYLLDAHHHLILHGRYTCTARKPKCPQCALSDLCPSRLEDSFGI